MAYLEIWDETKPAGTRDANLGDDDFREAKRALRERLAAGGMHFPSTDDANAGLFDNVKFIEQSANPTQEANRGFLFTKDVSGITELYWMDSAGSNIQLTTGGKILITSLAIASEARGDILRRGASLWERLALGLNGQFVKSNGTDVVYSDLTQMAPTSSFKNLKITRPSAATVTVTSDDLILDSGNRITSVSVTPNITVAGANGLDAGAEGASTWYYIWVIRKSSDGTVAGLLSTSSTAPTMPTGYDQKALVGAVRNDASSNFINFTQEGRRYNYATWQTLASGNVGTGAWVSIDTTAFVPASLSTYTYGTFADDTNNVGITNDSSVGILTITPNKYLFRGSGLSNNRLHRWELDILTANTLYWVSDTAAQLVYIQGFEINKLT